ncbi:MAG: MaoC family dehydratase [Hyphomicrobiaceae bacterium]|nr:MAG: MaoC family dehydratase [Hyphomicrobiaceae bacterium]
MSSKGKAAIPLQQLLEKTGTEIGVSRWISVDQPMIDAFAATTLDRQFIHIDPIAAARSPFGGTIAHGFLTLSLLSAMIQDALPPVAGRAMGVNYGFDKVRFITPVKSGARVRGRFTLAEARQRSPKEVQLRYAVTVEVDGEAKPALIADWLTLIVLA